MLPRHLEWLQKTVGMVDRRRWGDYAVDILLFAGMVSRFDIPRSPPPAASFDADSHRDGNWSLHSAEFPSLDITHGRPRPREA